MVFFIAGCAVFIVDFCFYAFGFFLWYGARCDQRRGMERGAWVRVEQNREGFVDFDSDLGPFVCGSMGRVDL